VLIWLSECKGRAACDGLESGGEKGGKIDECKVANEEEGKKEKRSSFSLRESEKALHRRSRVSEVEREGGGGKTSTTSAEIRRDCSPWRRAYNRKGRRETLLLLLKAKGHLTREEKKRKKKKKEGGFYLFNGKESELSLHAGTGLKERRERLSLAMQ